MELLQHLQQLADWYCTRRCALHVKISILKFKFARYVYKIIIKRSKPVHTDHEVWYHHQHCKRCCLHQYDQDGTWMSESRR